MFDLVGLPHRVNAPALEVRAHRGVYAESPSILRTLDLESEIERDGETYDLRVGFDKNDLSALSAWPFELPTQVVTRGYRQIEARPATESKLQGLFDRSVLGIADSIAGDDATTQLHLFSLVAPGVMSQSFLSAIPKTAPSTSPVCTEDRPPSCQWISSITISKQPFMIP
jgi:hypothetical protein